MGWGTTLSGFDSTVRFLDQIQMRWGENVTYVVGPTAKYGVFVERGTSKMRPQPYLEPAVRQVTRSLPRIMAKTNPDNSAEAVKVVALEIEALAKQFVPVDTGNLRASIKTERVR